MRIQNVLFGSISFTRRGLVGFIKRRLWQINILPPQQEWLCTDAQKLNCQVTGPWIRSEGSPTYSFQIKTPHLFSLIRQVGWPVLFLCLLQLARFSGPNTPYMDWALQPYLPTFSDARPGCAASGMCSRASHMTRVLLSSPQSTFFQGQRWFWELWFGGNSLYTEGTFYHMWWNCKPIKNYWEMIYN